MPSIDFNSVRLIKGGVISGDDKAAGSLTSSDASYSFGGAADLWGLSLSEADVEASNFGVAVSFIAVGYAFSNNTSFYLTATNFGISIPTGATIDGIEVSVEAANITQPSQTYNADVDHIQIKAYYTEAASAGRDSISSRTAISSRSAVSSRSSVSSRTSL